MSDFKPYTYLDTDTPDRRSETLSQGWQAIGAGPKIKYH